MNFITPNSYSFPEFDEANVASSQGWLLRQQSLARRRKRFREFNSCHSPEDGTFCSGRSAARGVSLKGERRAAVINAFRKVATGNEDYPVGRRETKVRVNRGLSGRADRARARARLAQRNLDVEQGAYDRVKSRDAARRRARFGVASTAGTFSKPSIDRMIRKPYRARRKVG